VIPATAEKIHLSFSNTEGSRKWTRPF
jgi:hypothetical protein